MATIHYVMKRLTGHASVLLLLRTWNTPPRGEAPKPSTETSKPVFPSTLRGKAIVAEVARRFPAEAAAVLGKTRCGLLVRSRGKGVCKTFIIRMRLTQT
jgi:hypothetical protein